MLQTHCKNISMIFKQLPTMISELNKLGIALKALDGMNLMSVGVNTGNLDAFRTAIKGLSTEQAVFALASKGATEEQIRQILITKQSEAAEVEAALAKAGLTTATASLTQAEMVELATKSGVAKADAEALLSKIGITAAEEGQVAVKKQVTLAMLEQAVANGTLTTAESAQIATMLGLNAVETTNIGITNVLTGAVAKLWAVITAHPIGAILTAVGAVAIGVIAYINKSNKDAQKAIVETHEKAQQALDDTKTKLSDDKSELESVNSELETTKQKIQDIASQDSITLTEQNELDKLSATNTQLKTQKSLLENNIKLKQKAAALDAKNLLGTQVEMDYSDIQDGTDVVSHKESYTYAEHAKYEASNLKNAYNIYMSALKDGNSEKQKIAQELIDTAGGDTAELTSSLLEIIESFKYDDGTIIEGYEDLYNQYMGLIYNLQSLTNPDMFLDIAKQATQGTNIDYEKAISDGYAMAYDGEFNIDKLNQDFVKALADNGIDESTIEYIFKLKQQEYQSVVDNINQKYNPDNVIKPTYIEEPNHVDTLEQSKQNERDNQVYEQQKQEVQRVNDELTEYAKENPVEFQLVTSYDEDFTTLDKYIAEEKANAQNALQDTKNQLADLSKNGNVDLTIRPVIDSSAMQAAGWDVEDGSIATTFTQGEFIWQGDEENGQYVYVHYTPITPDGKVMTPENMSDYLYGTLEGAQNILDADDKGLVLKVDTVPQDISEKDIKDLQEKGTQSSSMKTFLGQMGQWDDSLHDVQAGYYLTGDSVDYVDKAVNRLVEDAKKAQDTTSNETPISFKDAWSGLEKGKDELVKLAEAGRLTANDLKGLEGGNTLMEKTGLSAEQLAEKINKLTDASTQLSSLSGQVSKMSELLSKKKAGTVVEASDLSSFDAEVRGLDSWKEFEKVMGSSKSSMKECKKAADALATEWINDGSYLDKLTDSTKDYYVTQLKAMGVENAEEVVSANLAMKKQEEVAATEYATLAQQYNSQVKDEASQVSETLENATASEIIQLMNEGTMSEETRAALANYAFEKDYASSITLMTSADCENLANLCDSLNIAASALRNYAYAKGVYESTENWEDGKLKDAVRSGAKKTMDNLKDAAEKTRNKVKDKLNNQAKVKVKPSSGSSSKSGSGKSGSDSGKKDSSDSKKKFDEEFDWVEVRVNRLERAIDNYNDIIDNTYNNWSKRNKALEKEISRITSLITTQQKAQDIYKKKADKVTVKNTAEDGKSTKKQEKSFKKYKELVRKGKMKISDIKDEDVANAVKKYQEYYEKSLDAQDNKADAQKQLLDAFVKKFEMVSEKYDSIIGIYDTKKSNWETEYKGNIEAQGRDMNLAETKKYTSKRNDYEKKTQAQLEKERAELRKKQAEAVKKGIKKDSQEYKDMEKAILEVDQALQESKNTVANTAQEIKEAAINEFNEVSEKYDSIISTFDANKSTYDSAIRSSIESTGRQMNYGDASRYYGSLNNIEASTQAQLTAEIIELQKKLTQAVENGVDQTSNDFRTMQVALIDAQNALQDSQNAVSENTLAIYKTKWSDIDKQIDELDNVLSDSEFGRNLINELGDLYTKQIGSKPTAITGVMTDYGKATLSTYLNDINTYQSKLTKAQEGYADVLSKLVSDPNNDTFKEQANTYKQEIEDATLAIYSSKDDIISFYSDMYNEMLDSLKTISDNTIKQLQTEKDLYDYQKSMKEKTDSLSLLERQLNVYKNDSSESGKMNYQQIKAQLDEAKSDLSDVQYSQFLTDTQSLLDQMNEDASDWVEQTLADKTAIIETALGVVSSSVDAVKGVLDTVNTNITSIQTAVNNLNSFTSTSTSSGSSDSSSSSSGISNISVMPNGMPTVPQITVTPKAPLNDKKSSGASMFESVAIKKVSDRLASHPSSISQGTKNNSYVGVVNEGLKLLGYKTNSGNGYGDTTAAAVKKFCQDNKVNIDSKTKKTKASGKTMGNDFFKKLISVLKAKGYSKGGVITRNDMDLSALGLRTNNGDNKLVTVKEGERILTPVQNQNFEALTKYLQTNPIIPNISENLVSKIPDIQSTSVPSAYNDYRNVESINFTLPNVTNYDEFITKMQHDKKAISFIQDATIGVAMGKNSLKNRF